MAFVKKDPKYAQSVILITKSQGYSGSQFSMEA